jgi:glycosyltransferase involved in cell wall biosynthesis
LLIKRFGNKCDAIITPTVSTEEYLRHLGVSSVIETIPTGINLEEYRRWPAQDVRELRQRYAAPGEWLLISVSRMAKEKNLDFLLAGLAKIEKRTKVPFKCLLVGDGPEKARLEKRAEQLGLEERVFFTGNLEPREVVRHYLAADLFVFASTSETQGMVLVEAMAGGCPVVAVRASGVYDMVKDGFNGFKVAESTENWAKAVAVILEDNELWSLLSRNSLSFAVEYSVEKTAGRVMKLYRRVLALAGAGGNQHGKG